MKKGKKKISTGDKVVDNLYEAVREYIEARKGTVVVIGGIALTQESPLEFNYGVMVRITGKKPTIKNE